MGARQKALPLLACLNFACATTARLYPVEGPIHSKGVARPLEARVSGIMGNSGGISIDDYGGIRCEGEWSSAAGMSVGYNSASLIGQYGSVYGSGMSLATTGGQNQGRATLICPDGNILEIEFITGSGTASGFGIAKDNRGNVHRVQF